MAKCVIHPRMLSDGWNYAVVEGENKYIALAKKEPFSNQNPSPILEPGELYFELGDTPIGSLIKLLSTRNKWQN